MKGRVKVSTAQLLEAVRVRREREIKEHAKNRAKAMAERERLQVKVAKTLRDAADRAERGDLPDSGYNSLTVPWRGGRLPSKPDDGPYTGGIDRLIATLEMAAEPTILISAEDAAQYLG